MLSHRLTDFEIKKYDQNQPKFNGVYSRNNFSKIKNGTYIINLMSMNQSELTALLCMGMLKM